MTDEIDGELLQKIRGGDEAAARQLFRHLYPFVFKIVRNHLPARDMEEDLCQMIFLKVFTKLDQYSGRMPISHWVSRIAVNTCLNEIKKHRSRPELREADLGEAEESLLSRIGDASHDKQFQEAEARELASRFLALLTPVDRLIISLLHAEGHTVAEVSEQTGYSKAVIKIRAFRARKKLKTAIEKLHKTQAS
jgi:RNA polymerase sigma-70 factor (ECF subfamily)